MDARPPAAAPTGPRSALVVDEWALFRQGVAASLAAVGVEVVTHAGGAEEAMLRLWSAPADLLVVGNPAHARVSDLAAQVRQLHPHTVILVLLPAGSVEELRALLDLGVEGVLARSASPPDLEDAVTRLAAGQRVLAPAVVLTGVAGLSTGTGTGDHGLTGKELEVLSLLAEGLSNRAIATRLVVSEATVKSHLARLYAKLAVPGRAEAVRRALERRILS